MRILDRYLAGQLLPVWVWCLSIFIFLSCTIDLFGHLDEIIRYRVDLRTIVLYYLNFIPRVIVMSSPWALLLSSAFVGSQLSRYQELVAMRASGTSLIRSSVPFIFIGWLVCVGIFFVNERIVPECASRYAQLKEEAFRSNKDKAIDNAAVMDEYNRIYHARIVDLNNRELEDLTILEHDLENRPTRLLNVRRAVWTQHGWLLLYGTITRTNPLGQLAGDPIPFVERLIDYPVVPSDFQHTENHPELMRYEQLRLFIARLRNMGIENVRRYEVDLVSKLTFPFMNLVICLIGFVGVTRSHSRGNVRGLGVSLVQGSLYYGAVAIFQGLMKQWPIPIIPGVWAPHLITLGWCFWKMRKTY